MENNEIAIMIKNKLGIFSNKIHESIQMFINDIINMGYRIELDKKNNKHVAIYYNDLLILLLSFKKPVTDTEQVQILLTKFPLDVVSIVTKKEVFSDYWKYNLENRTSCLISENDNDSNILVMALSNIKSIFLADLKLNFIMNRVKFSNYRCFKNESFTFNDKSTVLLGINASGKTTLLDGIALGISTFLSAFSEVSVNNTILKDDMTFKMVFSDEGIPMIIRPTGKTSLEFEAIVGTEELYWLRSKSNPNSTKITIKDSYNLATIARQINEDINNEQISRQITLPVFSYHGTGRVAKYTNDTKFLERTEQISRLVGYRDCLKPSSNYKFFVSWYRKISYLSHRANKKFSVVNAVEDSIVKCFELLDEEAPKKIIKIMDYNGILVQYEDGELAPIDNLSDGYKDIIGIVFDIAHRMAILNPHLGESLLVETPGIVLIDEVDLHLHPRWQVRILKVLKTLFPQVQFITTTHAPLVITSTDENEAVEIIKLVDSYEKKVIGRPRDWYIDDLILTAFHLNTRPEVKENSGANDDVNEMIIMLSKLVKEYRISPNPKLLSRVNELYSRLLPSIPESSAKRKAVDFTMSLLEKE